MLKFAIYDSVSNLCDEKIYLKKKKKKNEYNVISNLAIESLSYINEIAWVDWNMTREQYLPFHNTICLSVILIVECVSLICIIEKQIDLSAVDLKKLKVRDLKKILNDWDETCDGCLEKTDYIRRIEELKPKYYKETAKEEL